MNKIGGYSIYQSDYYKSTASKKKEKAQTAEKTEQTRTEGVKLSDKAQKLLKELRKTYGNMDIMVADYETEEEAAAYLARGRKEINVLIDPEELEAMAADEEIKNRNLALIDEAAGKLSQMKEQMKEELGDKEQEVTQVGIVIGKDGTLSYFASLEEMSEKRKEQLEKKEEKTGAVNKTRDKKYDTAPEQRGKTTMVKASSIEELLEKIKEVDWSKVKEEPVKTAGGRFDYSI